MAILPLVEATRSRYGSIPDAAWLDAYIMGFVATLITLFATRQSGLLRADALASVQSGAWADITQTPGELAGEQILFLSVARDTSFLQGCRNAERFFCSLIDEKAYGVSAFDDGDNIEANRPTGDDEGTLWTYYFESRLSAYGDLSAL
jgi:hypothetical protein